MIEVCATGTGTGTSSLSASVPLAPAVTTSLTATGRLSEWLPLAVLNLNLKQHWQYDRATIHAAARATGSALVHLIASS